MTINDDASKWTITDVENWLKKCGFERFVGLFCKDHEIDGEALLLLTENDLRISPLQLTKLGDIKKLATCLNQLQEKQREISYDDIDNVNLHHLAPPPSSTTRRRRIRRHGNGFIPVSRSHQTALYSASSDGENSSEDQTYERGSVNELGRKRIVFNPEYKKTILSMIYCIFTMFLTSFTMVVVHDRVPDKAKHPPLPDIFLDNVPLMPQAFTLAEICGLILMATWICILILHKHRCILLRRMYSIGSSIFLLRCITMFVTSLSVPGDHLQCTGAHYPTMYARLERTFQICVGFGMSLSGLQTCGDYMFSGHTVILTIVNHLITEYTPMRMYSLHIASWVLNLFGIFFILAAHEHYSIDVVIAFYISSRIFCYYHMLANTRSYRHSKRIRIWFPLFSYFECNVPGKVPNEFEWPFTVKKIKNFFSNW